jgi:DNA invertase Pin-like site-specific DNA recombinase
VLVADAVVLGRSLHDLVAVLAEMERRGATVLVMDGGGIARPITAAYLEAARRAYAREAVMEGRAKAKARGVQFGRPRVVAAKVQTVQEALASGLGVRAAARVGGVGVATASRIRDAAPS